MTTAIALPTPSCLALHGTVRHGTSCALVPHPCDHHAERMAVASNCMDPNLHFAAVFFYCSECAHAYLSVHGRSRWAIRPDPASPTFENDPTPLTRDLVTVQRNAGSVTFFASEPDGHLYHLQVIGSEDLDEDLDQFIQDHNERFGLTRETT